MAIARPNRVSLEGDTPSYVVEETGPFARLRGAAPSDKPAEERVLALDQMRLAIEDSLLMLMGPEGDPVPPHVFSASAAAHPDALLNLPDGTRAPASRVAAVLRAQVLGRLAQPQRSSEWILVMLREGGGPEPASDSQLRAEEATDRTTQESH